MGFLCNWDPTGISWAVWGLTWRTWSVWGHTGPLGSFGASQGRLGLFGASQGPLGLFEASQGLLGTQNGPKIPIKCDFLENLEFSQNGAYTIQTRVKMRYFYVLDHS